MVVKSKPFNAVRDDWPNDEIAAKQWLEERIVRMEKEGIFAEVILLTPALAKEFRLHNADNRKIRDAKLKQVIDEIANDRFMLNGETIIFADTGQMNDGQHRCEAVINTMKSIMTVIVFGVSRDSRKTVDNGANRSPGDHLAVEGIKYATDIASIARFLLAWERADKRSLNAMNRISPTAIVNRGLDDVALGEAAEWSRREYTKAPVAAPSVMGFCYYAFSKIDPVAAGDYLKKVIFGANLDPESAAYQVRENLLALDRRVREHRIEYLFAGFVAHRAGLPLGKYRIRNELVPLDAKPRAPRKASKNDMVAGGELVQADAVKALEGPVAASEAPSVVDLFDVPAPRTKRREKPAPIGTRRKKANA